jgi:hypothetical protein
VSLLAAVPEHPLLLATLPLWGLLLATLPRDRRGLLLLLLALGTHAATYQPRIHYHRDRAYAEILAAACRMGPDTAYGDAWAALMGWPSWLAGGRVDVVHVADALLSALAVPHLRAALRRDLGDGAATFAAALLATSPLVLALAPTESRYVGVTVLEVAALHGLARRDRAGDLLLGLSAGVLAHLRPVEVVVATALALAAAMARRGLAAVLAGALIAWRLAVWAAHPPSVGGLVPSGVEGWTSWTWVGVDARLPWLDPTRTPVALPLLAAVGVGIGLRRAPRLAAGVVGLLAASTLPYLLQPYVTDRLRFELPAQAWLAALAGIGAAWVASTRAAPTLLLAALTWWPARTPIAPRPWQAEHALLRTALSTLPPGTEVAYDPALDDRGYVRDWAQAWSGVRLVPADEATGTPWRWVGLGDHVDGDPPAPGAPVVTARVDTGPEDLWGCRLCAPRQVELGLYRVTPPAAAGRR